MTEQSKRTLGQAIDVIITALEALPESSRAIAVNAACDHLGLTVPNGSRMEESSKPPLPSRSEDEDRSPLQRTDIRSLKDAKEPKSAAEMACVVAYYLESMVPAEERRSEISSKDLEKYFKQAQFPLPKVMSQVLVDARAAGYFDLQGRAKYKLNPVGHNLVVHNLPRSKK